MTELFQEVSQLSDSVWLKLLTLIYLINENAVALPESAIL